MKLGVDVLFEQQSHLVRGRRIGLITNPTGVDRAYRSIVERFRTEPGVTLAALYGPEHGVRGNAQAGEYVAYYFDEQFKLPVFSLYGQTKQPPADMITNIDAYMREYDTQHTGKTVEREMLGGVEAMVFDLQDVGTRVYTYIATMAYAMQAAAESGIPFIVLDRPNPIGGAAMEGPMLDYPRHSSFISLYPIPARHGMTVGELARVFNAKFLAKPANLTVVPMEGWQRNQWHDETDAPWVMPSPNMPTLATATVYPGQVLLEGTNLSEARGTTRPFELFGAPWIDGYELTQILNALNLPGAAFREAWFTPTFSKHAGQRCGGCQIHVTDRVAFRPVATTLHIVHAIRARYGDKLELHADYFDKVLGISAVREALERGEPAEALVTWCDVGLREFAREREAFLLYP